MAGSNPRGPFPGASDPSFRAWCDAFLDEQIQLMQPRAIVTLGRKAGEAFGWERGLAGMQQRAGIQFKGAALMHPSAGNLYKPRSGTVELWIDYEARVLKEVSVL